MVTETKLKREADNRKLRDREREGRREEAGGGCGGRVGGEEQWW